MEGNDWYNTGYTGYRNHYRGDDRPIDQDVFRGAYRFDNDSRYRDETTYDGFERRGERHESSRTYDHMQDNYGNGQSFYYNDTRNQRWDDRDRDRDRDRNREREHDRGYRQQNYRQGNDRDRYYRATNVGGNFDGNYSRDRYYSNGPDENYGNMAGSLSYGYDGDYNADWDQDRNYNPLTGHRQSHHGHYTSRHPEPDNTRNGRSLNRNRGNDYERY